MPTAIGRSGADALMVLLASRERRVITVDELRRGIEQLGAEAYDAMSYYERWVASITNTLLNKGVISADELGPPHGGGRGRGAGTPADDGARFAVGDRVAVRRAFPARSHPHALLRARCRRLLAWSVSAAPSATREELAFGRGDGPRQTLYRVRFDQTVLWPDYVGPPGDTIDIELYEHWLEPATE